MRNIIIKPKYILIALLFFVALMTIIIIYKYIDIQSEISEINYNNRNLNKNISEVDITDGTIIHLNSIIPFEWDTMYVFSAYFPKSEIEDIIDIKSSEIRTSTSDEMTQIIFIYDNKIVSSISNSVILGFQFKFESSGGYIVLHTTDNPVVKADTSIEKNITIFTFIES